MLILAPIFILLVILWVTLALTTPVANDPATPNGIPYKKFVCYNVIACAGLMLFLIVIYALI